MLNSIDIRPRLALVAAMLLGALALTADRADAAFTPTIQDRALIVTGDAAADQLALRVPAHDPATLEIDVGDDGSPDFRVSRARFDRIRVLAGGGDDRVRVDDSGIKLPSTTPTSIDGQDGADQLFGGRGPDELIGAAGEDVVDGNGGNDVAALGAGNDRFVWDPADGSDEVEGGEGFDALSFNGSNGNEQVRLAADGARARLTRDVGQVSMSLATLEQVGVAALGGDDALTVDDVTGTGVQEVIENLAAVPGGTAPDTGSDRLILNGTTGNDFTNILGAGPTFVLGLPAFVTIRHADPLRDHLTVDTRAGNDRIETPSVTLPFELVQQGGAGNDTLFGSNGHDVQIGGDGNDFVDGQRGNDIMLLGAGNDIVAAEAGDGSDVLEGGDGTDNARLSGSSANELFRLTASGERVRMSREAGSATDVADAADFETLSILSFGGADTVSVSDLSGTGVTLVDASLFDFGVPGGAQDVVVVGATAAGDRITASDASGVVSVAGLAATIRITGTAGAGDRLEINGFAGADTIDSTGLSPAEMAMLADAGSGDDVSLGGAGDDVLIGGDGADVLFTGSGDNVALGGNGDDVLRGEEGDDVLDGGAGDDVLIGGPGDDVLLNGEVVFDD